MPKGIPKNGINKGWFKKGQNSFNKGRKASWMIGKKNPHWNNGRYTDKNGYIYILSPDHPYKDKRGYVKEERIIFEKEMAHRYLLPKEIIHHINGIKDDNRIENLMYFPDQNTHKKFENAIKGNPMSGKHHTEESRNKMRGKRLSVYGENNPNYKHGKYSNKR